jgi:predicted AAA+ superfamily ATPase
MPEALHQQAIELYKRYFIVGGMPAAAAAFIESNSLLPVSEVQGRILNEYIADMAKYASPATSVKIRGCYNSIPSQLAKENTKFQYKVIQRGGTATIFGEAIDWLCSAGIALKCRRLEHGFIPVNAYVDLSDFKLYMGDIGMLTMRSGMPRQIILSPIEEDNTFLGAMTENYVSQTFASKGYPLLYRQSGNTAEVDFVLQKEDKIIPVEVKKGKRTRSISMKIFSQKYNASYAIRISKKNFGFENGIKSVPLYAVFCI